MILTTLVFTQLFLPGTATFGEELCPPPASLEALVELFATELAVKDLTFRCCNPVGSQALKDTRRGLLGSRISLAVVAVEMLLPVLKSLSLGAYSDPSLPCCMMPRRCGGSWFRSGSFGFDEDVEATSVLAIWAFK